MVKREPSMAEGYEPPSTSVMPGRTTTKPETTPAGEPAPVSPEEVQPTAPPPTAPEPAEEPAKDSLPPWPRSVGEAIAEVTRRIGAIEKTGKSSEGYRFRGIDQALAALHPILGDVGLVIVPGSVVREQWETRATAKGGTLNVARLLVSYTFMGPDGSTLPAAAWGEGADSGDKATQKAHSQSYKTLVFQAFTIPTEDSAADEPDATGEPARPFTAEEVARAVTAAQAADGCVGIDALAGVRRRALELLTVPVPLEDGSVVPLSVLFDQRRAALESAAGGAQ